MEFLDKISILTVEAREKWKQLIKLIKIFLYITGDFWSDFGKSIIGGKDWTMRNLTPNTSFTSIQRHAKDWDMVFLGNIEIKEYVLKEAQSFRTNIYEVFSDLIGDISACIE